MSYTVHGITGNNADEIIPGMWLGNYRVATDVSWLREKGIKCVFNLTIFRLVFYIFSSRFSATIFLFGRRVWQTLESIGLM